MSIKLMTAIFDADFPASEKLMLLAMADFANDDGKSIYPSQATLSRKTSLTDRTIRTLTKKLITENAIIRAGKKNSGVIVYELSPETISGRKYLPPETTSGLDRKPLPVRPETTSYDPLVNPSVKPLDRRDKNTHASHPSPSAPPVQITHTKDIKAEYEKLIGYSLNGDWVKGEGHAAKVIGDKFTVAQLAQAYQHYKSDKFWMDKRLTLSYLAKQMPELFRGGQSPAKRGANTSPGLGMNSVSQKMAAIQKARSEAEPK